MNKRDVDPVNVQTSLIQEDTVAVIDSVHFGASRPEHYWKKHGSATKGSGINTSLVAEVRATISQADCKGKTR